MEHSQEAIAIEENPVDVVNGLLDAMIEHCEGSGGINMAHLLMLANRIQSGYERAMRQRGKTSDLLDEITRHLLAVRAISGNALGKRGES